MAQLKSMRTNNKKNWVIKNTEYASFEFDLCIISLRGTEVGSYRLSRS